MANHWLATRADGEMERRIDGETETKRQRQRDGDKDDRDRQGQRERDRERDKDKDKKTETKIWRHRDKQTATKRQTEAMFVANHWLATSADGEMERRIDKGGRGRRQVVGKNGQEEGRRRGSTGSCLNY